MNKDLTELRFFYGIVARKLYYDMNSVECRNFLLKSNITIKNIILFITSYFPLVMKFILRNFDVGGVRKFNRRW